MSSWDTAAQLAPFAVAATFTPGPNALLLTSVAANYGLRPAVPAAVGIWAGIPILIFIVGIGLGEVSDAVSHSGVILHVAATVYILWLTWTVVRMSPLRAAQSTPRPPSALQAAALQWVNPKVWTMAAGAIGAFTASGRGSVGQALLACAVFAVVLLPAIGMWTLFGTAIRRWLTSDRRFAAFRILMGVLLAGSVVLTWTL
ncbi:MAG TPA: LysE family translocator [Mycobacteriales bacterium]|nr:LysE family translocator [Mycobacteriales bacterium]